jgi:hypothetical protein
MEKPLRQSKKGQNDEIIRPFRWGFINWNLCYGEGAEQIFPLLPFAKLTVAHGRPSGVLSALTAVPVPAGTTTPASVVVKLACGFPSCDTAIAALRRHACGPATSNIVVNSPATPISHFIIFSLYINIITILPFTPLKLVNFINHMSSTPKNPCKSFPNLVKTPPLTLLTPLGWCQLHPSNGA